MKTLNKSDETLGIEIIETFQLICFHFKPE